MGRRSSRKCPRNQTLCRSCPSRNDVSGELSKASAERSPRTTRMAPLRIAASSQRSKHAFRESVQLRRLLKAAAVPVGRLIQLIHRENGMGEKKFKYPQITQITQISVFGIWACWSAKMRFWPGRAAVLPLPGLPILNTERAPTPKLHHVRQLIRVDTPKTEICVICVICGYQPLPIRGSLLAELDDRQGVGLQRQSEIGRIFLNNVDTRSKRLCAMATQFCLLFRRREIRASHRFPFF